MSNQDENKSVGEQIDDGVQDLFHIFTGGIAPSGTQSDSDQSDQPDSNENDSNSQP